MSSVFPTLLHASKRSNQRESACSDASKQRSLDNQRHLFRVSNFAPLKKEATTAGKLQAVIAYQQVGVFIWSKTPFCVFSTLVHTSKKQPIEERLLVAKKQVQYQGSCGITWSATKPSPTSPMKAGCQYRSKASFCVFNYAQRVGLWKEIILTFWLL